MFTPSGRTLSAHSFDMVARLWFTRTRGPNRYGPYPRNLTAISALDPGTDSIATEEEICTVLGIDEYEFAAWPDSARQLAQHIVDRAIWDLAQAGSVQKLETARQDAARTTHAQLHSTSNPEQPTRRAERRRAPRGPRAAGARPRRTVRYLTVLAFLLVLVLTALSGRDLLQRFTARPADTLRLTLAEPLDSASLQQLWTREIPDEAVVTGFDTGITVEDGAELEVLSPFTGEELTTVTSPAPIEWITESKIDDRTHLIWRTTDSEDLNLWTAGMDQPATITSGTELTVSDAGTSLLLTDSTGDAYRVHDRGLDKMPTPDGHTALAVDGETLISSTGDATATLSDTDGRAVEEITLAAPEFDETSLERWVSAGHGLAVTVWAHDGGEQALVVHSLADGSVRSTVPIDPGTEQRWVRGQGRDLAASGPYLFSLNDGTLVADATDQDLTFARPKGALGVIDRQDDAPLVTAGTVARPLAEPLVAETDGVAVLRASSGTLSAHQLPAP